MTICSDGSIFTEERLVYPFQQILVYTPKNLEYQNFKFSVWRSAIQIFKVNLYPFNEKQVWYAKTYEPVPLGGGFKVTLSLDIKTSPPSCH